MANLICYLGEAIYDLDKNIEDKDFTVFRLGDRVEKCTGDYQLLGVIVALFTTTKGHIRCVVEHEPGFLHIYSLNNIRRIEEAII